MRSVVRVYSVTRVWSLEGVENAYLLLPTRILVYRQIHNDLFVPLLVVVECDKRRIPKGRSWGSIEIRNEKNIVLLRMIEPESMKIISFEENNIPSSHLIVVLRKTVPINLLLPTTLLAIYNDPSIHPTT